MTLRRKFVFSMFLLTISALIVACSAPAAPAPTTAPAKPAAPAPTSAPAAQPAAAPTSAPAAAAPAKAAAPQMDPTKAKATLKAGGGAVGGIGFVVMTALAKVVKDKYPNIDMTVVPGGWVGNLPRTDSGEMDLASTLVSMAGLATQKLAPFEKPMPNLRALYLPQDDDFFFAIVRKDFPADTVGEIVQKKLKVSLCTLPKGNTTELMWEQVFKLQGAGWKEMEGWGAKMNFVAWDDAVNLVKDGHADGILAVGAKQIGWATELATARDMKILKWEPDLISGLTKKFGFTHGTIPANTYQGIDYAVDAPRDTGEVIIRSDVKDDVAYAIVKSLSEGEKQYASSHAALSNFKAANMAKGLLLPIHPGAEAFYKEQGYLK